MLQKRLSSSTQDSSSVRQNKIMCTKCAKSFPSYQFEFHYEQCGEEDDYIIYHPEDDENGQFFDIDLIDLPIKGASVQLKDFDQSTNPSNCKLPIVPYLPKNNHQETEKCAFCSSYLAKGDKHAVLPCGHRLQFCCLKKWNIIVEPCRICRH